MKQVLINKKSLQQLQNTMMGVNEVQCTITHVLLGNSGGLWAAGVYNLMPVAFLLLFFIPRFHIHVLKTKTKAQLSFSQPLPCWLI